MPSILMAFGQEGDSPATPAFQTDGCLHVRTRRYLMVGAFGNGGGCWISVSRWSRIGQNQYIP